MPFDSPAFLATSRTPTGGYPFSILSQAFDIDQMFWTFRLKGFLLLTLSSIRSAIPHINHVMGMRTQAKQFRTELQVIWQSKVDFQRWPYLLVRLFQVQCPFGYTLESLPTRSLSQHFHKPLTKMQSSTNIEIITPLLTPYSLTTITKPSLSSSTCLTIKVWYTSCRMNQQEYSHQQCHWRRWRCTII